MLDKILPAARSASDALGAAAAALPGAGLAARAAGEVSSAVAAGLAQASRSGSALFSGVEARGAAAAHALEDGVWAVRRPAQKAAHVAAGMTAHALPVLVERAVSRALDRVLGGVWSGPLAPVGTVLAALEVFAQAAAAAREFSRLCQEADAALDAAERARLETRKAEAEARLSRARSSARSLGAAPLVASGGGLAAAFVADGARDAPEFEVRVLHGPRAGRSLADLPRPEVEAMARSAADPLARALIEAWLGAHPPPTAGA